MAEKQAKLINQHDKMHTLDESDKIFESTFKK